MRAAVMHAVNEPIRIEDVDVEVVGGELQLTDALRGEGPLTLFAPTDGWWSPS